MTRVYTLPGFWWRNNGSMAALVVIAIWGVWELWRAAAGQSDQSTQGYLFGAAFIGGAGYALWQLINDARDRVTTLDMDATSGKSVVTFWRPFWTETLAAERGAIGNWRVHVAVGKRNARTYFMHADHKAYPRPLQFELRQGIDISGLRSTAPEAVAEFEAQIRATGR